ncbi:hypothetical protein TARUN_9483 [Trichoderma arundinaceum]|uniref:Siderophore biosynthesis n=1 Tax=Trichoderma arundinaceum TaxID=490622 RepID=A0A395N9T8_TRIAR|nr:hypothetical protein TARUN_9483 [Trichoderma arundinaceum]
MRHPIATSALSLLVGANIVFAACETHSFTTCDDGIVHWFDPNNGQVCDPQDCGGGRAPPRTDVPGCPLYSGTLLSVPVSYLSCWTPSSAAQLTTPTAVSDVATTSEVIVTSAVSASDVQRTTEEPVSETRASGTESTIVSINPSTSVTSRPVTTSSSATSIKIPITSPATLSKSQSTHTASNVTSTSASTTTTSTSDAGNMMRGSLAAVVGAVIGAIAML